MVSAAILAGGAARRFGGRDKSRLVVGGRTVLERQLAAIAPLTRDVLLVGAPADVRAPDGVRAVADRVPGRGPLGGLQTALLEAAGDPTIVLACDMPFVTTAFLERLAVLVHGAGGFDAAVPRTDRGYHPLCAAYARAALDAIGRRLAGGRWTMSELLDDLRVRVVDAGEIGALGDTRRLLANINTPVDYREAGALQGHEP